MTSAYALNTQLARLQWGVFSLDNLVDWESAIVAATDDRDGITVEHYIPNVLHVVQCYCNGLDPTEYIDIHDLLWVNHVAVNTIIQTLVGYLQHFAGTRHRINIGVIHGTTDFIVECRNGIIQ